MKLGVHLGYWGLGLTSQDQLDVVLEAERLGYDSVWTAEAYGSDAATILGWLAGQTSTIRLGSAIFQMPGRSAAMTAMYWPLAFSRPQRMAGNAPKLRERQIS